MASTTSTASTRKLTLRMSDNDATRLDALRERRKRRLAQADGLGPPDRMSRSALALHFMRLGMTQAETAGAGTSEETPPDQDER